MLGYFANVLRGRCTCDSCRAVFAAADRELARKLSKEILPKWDDYFSDDDLARLRAAGFSDEEIRGCVEKMQRMLVVLVKESGGEAASVRG